MVIIDFLQKTGISFFLLSKFGSTGCVMVIIDLRPLQQPVFLANAIKTFLERANGCIDMIHQMARLQDSKPPYFGETRSSTTVQKLVDEATTMNCSKSKRFEKEDTAIDTKNDQKN